MKSSTAIESLMFLCGIVNLKGQVIPDCDSEFSSQAAGVIRSRIDDPVKMNRIETILSACNKSRMQKLTEISVFLLEKSVFPSRVLDDLHSLEQVLKDERFKRLEIMRQSLPSNLGKTMDEVSNIQTNNSLSGNEKLLSLLNTIAALPREYRRLMEDFLNREATPTQVNLKYDIGGGLYSLHGQSAKVSSDSPMPKNDQNPTPFSMKKDLDQVAESHKNISPNALIRKSDMLSLDESPSPDLFEVPPVIYKYNIPNTQSFDLLTKV
uniref:CARD domain-containing protein n=1 Tax=Angiostrongylus cantonensis TaxID=6313 RepID=A0A0K0DL58_ANGCA